jgi:hypothetical protein
LIRRDNKIDINLDSDDFAEDSTDSEDEMFEDDDEEELIPEDNATTKRTPPIKKHPLESKNDTSEMKLKKRKTAKSQDLNKDGPITKTKRKRLVSNADEKVVASKKRVVEPGRNSMKTRKVKQKTDAPETKITKRKTVKKEVVKENEEIKEKDVPAKKRKSVKRKKNKSKVKSIDEDKLQEGLASDFLNDD